MACLSENVSKSTEKASNCFLQFLITFEYLEMLAFLDDILIILSKFQKNLQADNITIVDMERVVDNLKVKINTMKNNPLLRGWLIYLRSQIDQNQQKETVKEGIVCLKGIQLHQHH